MRYRFIKAHLGIWPVSLQCLVLMVTRSGYYRWQSGTESVRSRRQKELLEKIREIYVKNRKRYGRRRVYKGLVKAGIRVSQGTVGKLMRNHGIRPWYTKAFRRPKVEKTRKNVSPNSLNRNFQPGVLNKTWLSDLTQVKTSEGWLYLSVVEDLGSRRVLGWCMSSRMKTDIVLVGLRMAFSNRRDVPSKVLFHSDQGSQYRSLEVWALLKAKGLESSMSRKGNCWDNSPMESFFATLKRELYLDPRWTRQQVKTEVFEFIEGYYNTERLHSTLGYASPMEYETQIMEKDPQSKSAKENG